jgi:hypothetical protein
MKVDAEVGAGSARIGGPAVFDECCIVIVIVAAAADSFVVSGLLIAEPDIQAPTSGEAHTAMSLCRALGERQQ